MKRLTRSFAAKRCILIKATDHFREIEQFKPQPKQYISGEPFFIQGRGLRLQVSQAKNDYILSDGVYIYLEAKDLNDSKKRRLVVQYID